VIGLRTCLLLLLAVAVVTPALAQPPQAIGPFASEPATKIPAVPKSDLRLPGRSDAPPSSGTKPRAAAPAASLWGTVTALGVIAVGLFLAVRWLKQHGPPSLRGLPNEAVEPLGQRILSRGVAVHLVRCGSRMLLLGVGPDGIRTLSEITDPVEIDLLSGACRRRDEMTSGLGGFAQVWQRTTSRAAGPATFPSTGREVGGG
jgi:flagellar biogenesis protein FliO